MGQRYHACSYRGSKSQLITMPFAKKKRKLGSSTWTSAGWNLAPDPPGLCNPSKGVSSCSHVLVPLSCSGMGTVTDTRCQKGVFSLCAFSLPLSSPVHPVLTMYADITEGEAFPWGTDLSRPSKVAAGISDYLMGLADYEKAFAVGFLRKGKWPGGCLDVVKLCMKSWWSFSAKPQAQDQMGDCRSGLEYQASKQGSLWIVLLLAEDRELNISAQPGRWEKPSQIAHSQDKCLTKAAFLLHQTALLQNSFAASMQTEPPRDFNRYILLLMKGSLEGAKGSQFPHGCALKSLRISACICISSGM